MQENIGGVLSAALAAKGKTAYWLAKQTNLSTTYITRLCQGRVKEPGYNNLQTIARALGYPTFDALREAINGAGDDPSAFPTERLRQEGLREPHLSRLRQLWERYPDRRATYLEKAQNLARLQSRLDQAQAELEDEARKGTDVHPMPHPFAG